MGDYKLLAGIFRAYQPAASFGREWSLNYYKHKAKMFGGASATVKFPYKMYARNYANQLHTISWVINFLCTTKEIALR